VSTQVIPRDRHAALLNALALAATGLDRIATEIRNLQRTEIGELGEPFGKSQRGSSAMPHKQNPIICERVTSLARVVRAYASVGMENVVLWHERDLTNSANERLAIPGALGLLHYMLLKFTPVLAGLVVRADRMAANLQSSGGVFFSQALLLALVDRGMSRDSAYKLAQGLAFRARAEGKRFTDLAAADPQVCARLDRRALARVFDLNRLLRNVDAAYRRVGLTSGKR
jgi:adenylosuccinate lyase